ncbi:MAG: TIGR03545 family protein [Spirochaetales bacterium]|nr:TIGR03545 family protein [Spirochaetales bacterium]
MAKKLPKIFRKEYTEEKFNKKIVKRIYLKEYKEALQKAARKTTTGTIIINPDLDKKEKKQIKKIAKSVKKNTGFVLKGRLILLALAAGAIILFSALFKDMLIEQAAEAGLQAVFNAKVDIQGLSFQIFAGRLSFNHLEVANSDKPMRNLFELGETAFDIDLFELLKGKVILDNIMCHNIKWDTPRQTSGALSGAPQTAAAEQEAAGEEKREQGLFDFDITEQDITNLLEEQKQNLASFKLLADFTGRYPELSEKWQDSIQKSSKKIDELSASIDKISAIDINKIKTPAQAQSAYNTIKPVLSDVEKLKKDIEKSSKDFQQDFDTITKDRDRLFKAIDADYENLTGMLNIPQGEKGGIVSVIAQGILEQYVGELYAYLYQARSYMDMLRPTSEQQVKENKPARFRGQDIQYPSFVKPKFWLKTMSFSVVDDESFGTISGELQHAASQPDLINKPMTFELKQALKEESVALNGKLDLRTNRSEVLALNLMLKGFPFKLEQGLEFLAISDMDCTYRLDIAFSLDSRNYSSGSLQLTLTELAINYTEDSLITRGLKNAIDGLDFITIGARYSIDAQGALTLEITDNNLDKLIQSVISSIIAELTGNAMQLLEQELDKLLESDLKQYEEYYQDFIDADKDSAKNLLEIKNYEKTVNAKMKEVEKKIKKYEEGITDTIEDKLDDIKDIF